jgi:hypothetical protein
MWLKVAGPWRGLFETDDVELMITSERPSVLVPTESDCRCHDARLRVNMSTDAAIKPSIYDLQRRGS